MFLNFGISKIFHFIILLLNHFVNHLTNIYYNFKIGNRINLKFLFSRFQTFHARPIHANNHNK